MNQFQSNSIGIVTSSEINAMLRKMPQSDRDRVLAFCKALVEQRRGKRDLRQRRFI